MGEAEAKSDEKTKAAAEGLRKLLDILAPEAKDDAAATAPANPVDELYGAISGSDVNASAVQTAKAFERYRNAMRWLVGAVAAIGVVLFGSTGFTAGNPLGTWMGWGGLGLASLGLVLILVAATLVFEPEDASLGELGDDFDNAGKHCHGLWKLHPRWAAIIRFKKILEGHEAQAHLGPCRKTVKELIDGISTSERARVDLAIRVSADRRTVEQGAKEIEILVAHLEALTKARAVVEAPPAEAPPAEAPPAQAAQRLDVAIAETAEEAAEAVAKQRVHLDQLGLGRDELAIVDYQLGVDMLHRALVLDESAVAQLRGTFKYSRVLLLVGAASTLIGTLLYVSAVKGEADAPRNPVVLRAGTMVVSAGTPSSDELPGKCVGQPLQVVLFAKDTPALADKFDLTVSAPAECADKYTIPGGRGSQDAVLDLAPAVEVPRG